MKNKKNKNVTSTLKKIMNAGSPTEILQNAMGQVNKKVTDEMMALIRKIDFVQEFSKFAENHKFKISMDIEISKKDKK